VVCETVRRDSYSSLIRRALRCSIAFLVAGPSLGLAQNPSTIERIKPSIVAVGTFERLRNPQFSFSGTGFAVGNGLLITTNAHVLPTTLNSEGNETIAIAWPSLQGAVQVRAAQKVASDTSVDLALLSIDGPPLPAVRLGNSDRVREGEIYLFTGFPIGAVLGLFPVTHRTMIAAVTPIVIPAARADQLDARSVRRLQAGAFPVFQLDGTAYPGNSGSPVYHPESGEVIGIVNSVFVKGTKEAALTQPSGISYAIPAQKLKELLDRAR
jgi:S1-C subfamily serine protease